MSRKVGSVTVAAVVLVAVAGMLLAHRSPHNQGTQAQPDPRLVCNDPSYIAITLGMRPPEVARLLGRPQQQVVNPTYVKQPETYWQALEAQRDVVRNSIGPVLERTNMRALEANPRIRAQFDRLIAISTELEGRRRTIWYYDTMPGWNGGIEIYFDDRGRVVGSTCGYG